MPPVKKLRLILEDTLTQMADLEQQARNVLVRFTCYRNSRPVHQSSPMKRSQLSTRLPEACRQQRATEIAIVVTGTNQQLENIELHRARFLLAPKQPARSTHHSGGLGAYESEPVMADPWGGGGLGAVQEAAAMVDHIVSDELFRIGHERLQLEAEALRTKVTKLETELKEQEAINDARDVMKERIEQLSPFIPIVAQLVGPNTQAGKALSGLAGVSGSLSAAPDDEHTTMVLGLVRGFMTSLHEAHKGQLVWVMQRVQQNPNLIPRLVQFIQAPPPNQSTNTKQKPAQDAADHDNKQEKV